MMEERLERIFAAIAFAGFEVGLRLPWQWLRFIVHFIGGPLWMVLTIPVWFPIFMGMMLVVAWEAVSKQ